MASADAEDLRLVKALFLDEFKRQHPKSDAGAAAKKLDDCLTLFNKADADGSGDVDYDEIAVMFAMINKNLTKAQLKALITLVDDDNTGTLRFCEFCNLMLIEAGLLKEPLNVSEAPVKLPRTASGFFGFRRKKAVNAKGKRGGALKKKKRGHLHVDTQIEQSAKGHSLHVKVFEGKDLLPCDFNGFSDPYVKLHLEPDPTKAHKRKTKVIKKTLNPTFNETFQWHLPAGTVLMDFRLIIEVMDYDLIGRNDFIGKFSFTLEEILDGNTITSGWFILLDEVQGATNSFPSRAVDIRTDKGAAAASAGAATLKAQTKTIKAGAGKYSAADFDFLKVLGRGSFGKVMLARDKKTTTLYAVKFLKKLSVIADNDVPATMTERRVLALPENPQFLARLYASFQTDAHLCFVMELINGGDLMFHVMKAGTFSEKTAVFYSAEISSGLWFLHDRGILYRDLKLDNVMLDHEGHVKLADFGLCKEGVPATGKTSTFCGTPDYIAPEIIEYKPYGRGVDWWSLGVVVYEMLTGMAPFDGDDEDVLFRNILHARIDMPRWLSKESVMVMHGFLTRDPAKRLGSGPHGRADIKAHRFYRSLDWAALETRSLRPPIVPKIKDPTKAEYFDPEFTSGKPTVTPEDPKAVANIDQGLFQGFTFLPGAVEEPLDAQGRPLSFYGFYQDYAVPSSRVAAALPAVPENK